MSDTFQVDFTKGDGWELELIRPCPICGEDGVKVKTMSDQSVIVEHIILWDVEKTRARMEIIKGCFRQKKRIYIIK